jgi:hypothetical protein
MLPARYGCFSFLASLMWGKPCADICFLCGWCCRAVVGDFGNGGQTILDEATFAAIKEQAQALGAVDASGLNHSKLSSGRAGWNKLLHLCCMSRCGLQVCPVVVSGNMLSMVQPGARDNIRHAKCHNHRMWVCLKRQKRCWILTRAKSTLPAVGVSRETPCPLMCCMLLLLLLAQGSYTS